MHRDNLNLSLLVLLIGVSVLMFFVFAPFLSVLALSAVFAVLLRPVYDWAERLFRGSKTLASLATVFLMLMLCIVPLFLLGVQITKEAQHLYLAVQTNGSEYLQTVETALQGLVPGLQFDLHTYISNGLVFVANHLGSFLYQTLYLLFATFIMLLTLYFFLHDGKALVSSFKKMSPFGREVTDRILAALHQTTRSIVRGTLYIALLRWLCIWVAFALFRIPDAVFWSSVGGVLGAIPGVGTAFGFAGAVIYLYLAGQNYAALGLAVVGVVTATLIDNILTTYFYGKGIEVPPIFVLFSILGGLIFFGPLGFIFGPLVLSVFVSVVRAYEETEAPQG